MSGKSSSEFQWTDDEIQPLLEATQNLKVAKYYKMTTRFHPRATLSYVLVFLHSVVSFYKTLWFLFQTLLNLHWKNVSLITVSFLFLFKLKIIPNYRSRCISIRFLEWINSYPIRLVSLSESECFNPSPLQKLCRKNYVPMETEGLSDMKIGTEHNDPVWWKHSIRNFYA